MKSLIIVFLAFWIPNAYSQGTFLFSNLKQPTRVGSLEGAFAGPEYFGRMLAGPTAGELTPVGPTLPHRTDGTIGGIIVVSVPTVPCLETAYVQFVAWDGRVWGNDLSLVPDNQIGRTDVVPLTLSGVGDPNCSGFPRSAPYFTRPAVVPAVPEPSTWVLLALGAWWTLRLRAGHKAR